MLDDSGPGIIPRYMYSYLIVLCINKYIIFSFSINFSTCSTSLMLYHIKIFCLLLTKKRNSMHVWKNRKKFIRCSIRLQVHWRKSRPDVDLIFSISINLACFVPVEQVLAKPFIVWRMPKKCAASYWKCIRRSICWAIR